MPTTITNLTLNRQIGIEMEGYVNESPLNFSLPRATMKTDGSLRNCYWNEMVDDEDYKDSDFGVEVNTQPLTDLGSLQDIMSKMEEKGWHVDNSAGTHIHVDISDYTEHDKAKLLRFAKGIERIMFLFVNNSRNSNTYCGEIHKHWRMMFRNKSKFINVNWEEANQVGLMNYLARHRFPRIANGKYTWLNVYSTRYPTAEFRIFHGVSSLEEIQMFSILSHDIVELVKNTSIDQLEFIIKSLFECPTLEELLAKFNEVLGLTFEIPVVGEVAKSYLVEKLASNNKSTTVAV